MKNSWSGVYRFLKSQSWLPLVLSTLLALALYVGRVIYGRTWHYNNLVWNLFLAWIPYGCSFLALMVYKARPRLWWALLVPGAIWLLFFPNAPYIVTDFLHLLPHPPVPLWYDIGLLASFAWTGCFLAVASLRTMQFLVQRYLGVLVSWIFVAVSLVMSGLGIYLGRFGRFNSWDVFIQPTQVAKDVLLRMINPFNNLRFFGFTLMFTAFLFVLYLMFTSMSTYEEMIGPKDRV